MERGLFGSLDTYFSYFCTTYNGENQTLRSCGHPKSPLTRPWLVTLPRPCPLQRTFDRCFVIRNRRICADFVLAGSSGYQTAAILSFGFDCEEPWTTLHITLHPFHRSFVLRYVSPCRCADPRQDGGDVGHVEDCPVWKGIIWTECSSGNRTRRLGKWCC
jgi:hypothetical protein